MSIYGKLLNSIHRIKNQLYNEDSGDAQRQAEVSNHQDRRLNSREPVPQPRDTDYIILDQSQDSPKKQQSYTEETRQPALNYRPVPELAISKVTSLPGRHPEKSLMETSFAKPFEQESPDIQNEVFDNLLMRLDKLKETLELDRSHADALITSKTYSGRGSRHEASGRSMHIFEIDEEHQRMSAELGYPQQPSHTKYRQGSPGNRFHELSPIGIQFGDHSMEDQSKSEILAIIGANKSSRKEIQPKNQSPKNNASKKDDVTMGDLEYSASKKESYQSQIDDFLTNETHMTRQNTNLVKLEVAEVENQWKKITEKQKSVERPFELKKLVPLDQNRPAPEVQPFMKLQPLASNSRGYPAVQNKENSCYLNGSQKVSNEAWMRNQQQGQLGNSSTYFARLMRDYGIRHQEEELAFQRREQKFQKIKNILDKEERMQSKEKGSTMDRSESKRSRSKKSSKPGKENQKQHLQKIQDKLSNLDQKINQYEFTFKHSDVLGSIDAPKYRDQDEYSGVSKNKQSRANSRITRYEEKSQDPEIWRSDKMAHRSTKKDHVFENWGDNDHQNDYTSNNDYSSVKSVKPPISFEIPVDDGRGLAEISDRSTLKDAYSRFVARKSQRNMHRPTHSSVEKERHYISSSEHRSHSTRNSTVNLANHSVSSRPQTVARCPKASRESSVVKFEDAKHRKSDNRTEAEISVAKNRQQRANAKMRNERIKNYDSTRRNIR